jgi:hypothetical protein
VTSKPLPQKILKGILHIGDENKQNHEMMGIIKLQEKKKRKVIRK